MGYLSSDLSNRIYCYEIKYGEKLSVSIIFPSPNTVLYIYILSNLINYYQASLLQYLTRNKSCKLLFSYSLLTTPSINVPFHKLCLLPFRSTFMTSARICSKSSTVDSTSGAETASPSFFLWPLCCLSCFDLRNSDYPVG